MGIDIFISKNNKLTEEIPESYKCGITIGMKHYFTLFELIQNLQKETGIYIDLYGDAYFSNEKLVHLKDFIKKSNAAIANNPDVWEVYCGKETYPQKKDIYVKVDKKIMKDILVELNNFVLKAEKEKAGILFVGD